MEWLEQKLDDKSRGSEAKRWELKVGVCLAPCRTKFACPL